MKPEEIREAVQTAKANLVDDRFVELLIAEPCPCRFTVWVDGDVWLAVQPKGQQGWRSWLHVDEGHVAYKTWSKHSLMFVEEARAIRAALEAMPPEQWYWDEETEGFQRRYAPGGVYIGDAEDVSELNPHARRLWAHDLHLTPAYTRAVESTPERE